MRGGGSAAALALCTRSDGAAPRAHCAAGFHRQLLPDGPRLLPEPQHGDAAFRGAQRLGGAAHRQRGRWGDVVGARAGAGAGAADQIPDGPVRNRQRRRAAVSRRAAPAAVLAASCPCRGRDAVAPGAARALAGGSSVQHLRIRRSQPARWSGSASALQIRRRLCWPAARPAGPGTAGSGACSRDRRRLAALRSAQRGGGSASREGGPKRPFDVRFGPGFPSEQTEDRHSAVPACRTDKRARKGQGERA